MSLIQPAKTHPSSITHSSEPHPLAVSFSDTTKKIKELATSPLSQGIFGVGLGIGIHHKFCIPLVKKIVKAMGVSTFSEPSLDLGCKILLSPLFCILFPLIEERGMRGDLQERLKNAFYSFYRRQGYSHFTVVIAAHVSSLFFTSVIFGFSHFFNALIFRCNPYLFLPQVVAATLMGFILGLAKEFSGGLYIPTGIHIGNNTLAWLNMT